jgi:hypothetical protein
MCRYGRVVRHTSQLVPFASRPLTTVTGSCLERGREETWVDQPPRASGNIYAARSSRGPLTSLAAPSVHECSWTDWAKRSGVLRHQGAILSAARAAAVSL